MSRTPSSPSAASSSAPGGLMPLESSPTDQAPAAGVFRLEGLAPGADAAGGLPAPKKRKVSSQAIALAVLLAVGGGMIYGMRLLGIGPLTRLVVADIPNYDLTKPSARAADHQKIIQDLAANHAASQVPVEEVQKNPFKMADVVTPAAPAPGDPNAGAKAAADRARREADARHGRVQGALASLKVNGILGGSRPVARISGEAVRVGDSVSEGMFVVTAIHGRSVELKLASDETQTFELTMDEDGMNSTKPTKKK